jgi:predicted phosphohydrolase
VKKLTVKMAIKILQSLPPNMVIVKSDHDGYYYTLSDIKLEEITKESQSNIDDKQVNRTTTRVIIK